MPSDEFSRAITPQEKEKIEWDRKIKASRLEEELRSDFFAEEIALQNGGTISTKNKAILRHGRIDRHHENEEKAMAAFGGLFITSTGIREVLQTIQNAYIVLSGEFSAKANIQKSSAHFYECKDYKYDEARVSPKTQDELEKESAEIESKLRTLDSIQDEDLRKVFAQKIMALAEQYQMRRHPVTNVYVHDIARVEEAEHIHNPRQNIECTGTVCVYRVKAQIGDMRGVSQRIGDVYNEKIEEAIITGDHLPKNAPRPHLH